MNWFEEQIETRRQLDEEQMEDAYARLAASVMSSNHAPRFTLDDAAAADSAISAVLAYYGAEPASIPDDIVDPADRVNYAVRPTGIMKRAVRLEGSWWKDSVGAYLAVLTDGTPVALIPRSPRGYGYVDPVTHRKVHITRKTVQNLEPEALCFYRPLPQRELSVRDVVSFMLHSLDLGDYILILVATIVSTFIGTLPPMANKLLFGRVIPSGIPSLIQPIAALLIGMTFSQALIQITSSVITSRTNFKLRVQMEAATYARVMLLPSSFFKQYAAGDLSSRIMGMTQLADAFSQIVLNMGFTGVFSLVYILQIFAFAPQLVLPAFIVILAQVAATLLVVVLTIHCDRVQMKAKARLSGVTPSLLHGIQKIKLAGAERRSFAHWARLYANVTEATYHRPAILLAGPSLVPVIGLMGLVVIYYLAAITHVSMADFMAFSTAFGAVSGVVRLLANNTATFASVQPLLEMVEPIMRAVPETLGNKRQVTSVTGGIDVNNLWFRYSENMPFVLKDISLRIHAGEYVAIVGRTGCGKSTLMRLLLGFEYPTKGAIYYNSQDYTTVDIRSLRSHIGVVMQNGSLFQGDIFMNITVATPKATLEDAWEAAEIAGIADDIRKMPMGMRTLINDNGSVSGGQRQRILIARAVCGKPKILMLDEATSALDNVTQKHVSDALEGLRCTRLVIAHRLSTVRHADRIVMLEDGAIVEDGTYDELMAAGGRFADLVARQQLEGE